MRRVSAATTFVAMAVALVAMVVMAQSAWSQGGKKGPAVQGEVHVGPSGAPAASATPGAPASPAASPAANAPTTRPRARNPFVPPAVILRSEAPPPPTTGTSKTGSKGGPGAIKKGPVKTVVVRNPPEFTLAGILQSGGYLKAMLISNGTVKEAKVGDVVEGYRVVGIDMTARQVSVEKSKTVYKVKLPRDMPYGKGGAPEAGSNKGSGGPSQGGPLPPPPPPVPGGPGKGK